MDHEQNTQAPQAAAPQQEREQREPREQRENREPREQRPQGGRPRKRKKVCAFCAEKIVHIDYKDVPRLRKHLSERAKILPRRVTGTCAKHQRQLTTAVKRARHIALIPYTAD